MTADLHGNAFRCSGPDHVPYGSPPEIVEQLAWTARQSTGSRPSFAKVHNGLPVMVE